MARVRANKAHLHGWGCRVAKVWRQHRRHMLLKLGDGSPHDALRRVREIKPARLRPLLACTGMEYQPEPRRRPLLAPVAPWLAPHHWPAACTTGSLVEAGAGAGAGAGAEAGAGAVHAWGNNACHVA